MQNININYIENGIKKIKMNRDKINISKVFKTYGLGTDVIYKNTDIQKMQYESLLKLEEIIKHLESENKIPKSRETVYKNNQIKIEDLNKQLNKINHLESKLKLKYKK